MAEAGINKFQRCEADDPNRCQAVHATMGQCPFKAIKLEDETFAKYCIRHGGKFNQDTSSKINVALLRAAQWQSRLDNQSQHADIKSLRNEIGVLRIVLEEKLQACQGPAELMMMSSSLGELINNIARTVKTCHSIDKDLGVLLDKQQAIQLAKEFVTIVGMFITDPLELEMLAEMLIEKVAQVASNQHLVSQSNL